MTSVKRVYENPVYNYATSTIYIYSDCEIFFFRIFEEYRKLNMKLKATKDKY